MTGYGKSEFECNDKKITIEVKSLNSKQLDLSCRISSLYREKELEIRKIIAEMAVRGKVEFSLYVERLGVDSSPTINADVVKNYYNQLKEIMIDNELIDKQSFNNQALSTIIKLPDTIKNSTQAIDENEWEDIVKAKVVETIKALNEFRAEEGISLEKDMRTNIESIQKLIGQVEPYEKQRIETIKQRFHDKLSEIEMNGKLDNNRLEQELIFYIERLDVNEEKVRLTQHCNYFLETMDKNTDSIGKKLGFIAQEIGREINTLGSKANETNIQRIVVNMKDSLERIKEQTLNAL